MHDDHANPSACQYIHHQAQYHMSLIKLLKSLIKCIQCIQKIIAIKVIAINIVL